MRQYRTTRSTIASSAGATGHAQKHTHAHTHAHTHTHPHTRARAYAHVHTHFRYSRNALHLAKQGEDRLMADLAENMNICFGAPESDMESAES